MKTDRPNDAILFMERALLALVFLAFIGALLFGVLSLKREPDVAEVAGKAAAAFATDYEKAIEKVGPTEHPIPFKAVVVQSGNGINAPAPRLYVPRSER